MGMLHFCMALSRCLLSLSQKLNAPSDPAVTKVPNWGWKHMAFTAYTSLLSLPGRGGGTGWGQLKLVRGAREDSAQLCGSGAEQHQQGTGVTTAPSATYCLQPFCWEPCCLPVALECEVLGLQRVLHVVHRHAPLHRPNQVAGGVGEARHAPAGQRRRRDGQGLRACMAKWAAQERSSRRSRVLPSGRHGAAGANCHSIPPHPIPAQHGWQQDMKSPITSGGASAPRLELERRLQLLVGRLRRSQVVDLQRRGCTVRHQHHQFPLLCSAQNTQQEA